MQTRSDLITAFLLSSLHALVSPLGEQPIHCAIECLALGVLLVVRLVDQSERAVWARLAI
jgi:hypothetical protein